MSARPSDELSGRLVAGGRYRVDNALDSGGMGTVYAGIRMADGLPVALKALHPALARETRHVDRFRRECRVTAMLEHPHIVRVLEATDGAAGEPPFLVMELLGGTSLQARLRASGPVPPREAVSIARQLLAALSAAHSIGILHRDLKPSNVLLVPGADGKTRVKVIDFGVAGLMETDGYQKLTRTGHVVGTPAYMPPEQALGVAVDERADVYSAGAILFAAVTGKHPYRGRVDQIIPKLLEGDRPTLRDLAPRVDPRLADMVETAMSTSADRRFRSAAAFGQALGILDDAAVTTVDTWRSPLPLETLRLELNRDLDSATTVTSAPPTALDAPAPTKAGDHRRSVALVAGALGIALALGLVATVAGVYVLSTRDPDTAISSADGPPPIQAVVPVTPSTGGAAIVSAVSEAPPAPEPEGPREEVAAGAPRAPGRVESAGAPPHPRPRSARRAASPVGLDRGRDPEPQTAANSAAPPTAGAGSADESTSTDPRAPGGMRRRLEVSIQNQQGARAPQAAALLRSRLGDLLSCVDGRGGPAFFSGSFSGTVDESGVMAAPDVFGSHPAAVHCLRQRLPGRWPNEIRGHLTLGFVHTNVD